MKERVMYWMICLHHINGSISFRETIAGHHLTYR